MCMRSFKHTTKLNEKRHHIAGDEAFRQPPLFDQTVRFAVHTDDDAAQYHVYACREQSRSDEKKEGLNDIGTESRTWRLPVRYSACCISNGFELQ